MHEPKQNRHTSFAWPFRLHTTAHKPETVTSVSAALVFVVGFPTQPANTNNQHPKVGILMKGNNTKLSSLILDKKVLPDEFEPWPSTTRKPSQARTPLHTHVAETEKDGKGCSLHLQQSGAH